MGNHRSRLRRCLAHGDEAGAIELLKSNEEFRKKLDIEFPFEKNDGCNLFHLACLHGLENIIRTFLVDYQVDVTKKNLLHETPFHCLSRLPNSMLLKDLPQYHGDRKHKCLRIILDQEGKDAGGLAVMESMFLSRDINGETPVHVAAAHGFLEVIEEILRITKSPLTMKNSSGEMPIDLADQFGQETVAQLLESSIIFETGLQTMGDIEDQEDWAISHTQCFDGLKTQDLQHKKDQLVVETSDMLHLPLFTAEALLRTFDWSRQALLDTWFENPEKCCKNAGVKLPESVSKRKHFAKSTSTDLELGSPKRVLLRKPDSECSICAEVMPNDEQPVYLACEHDFCRSCWREYLTMKIQDGNIYPIFCPASLCSMLVPCDVVESLVSRDIARKYLQFDIEAFVESNPSMKWCTFAGCERAVCRPEIPVQPFILNIPHMKAPLETSHAVDCGNGHYFCWECSGEAHEPCSCDKWAEWHQRIIDVRPEEIKGTHEALEEAANSLWLVTNSKPCPNCKSPIQKTDGCNHMKCSKCKHDFCWVCGDPWKKHSTQTGGYFRCNRADAAVKAQDETGKLISAAEEKSRRMNELNRFVKFYGKYKIQDSALQKATPFIDNIDRKMSSLAATLKVPLDQLAFLQQATLELQKARKVLKGSCVYAYYLEDHRMLFEYMQNELEKATDLLDGLVARRYLRSCKEDITKLTRLVRRRRHEFIVAVNKGLIIPETPPSVRKRGRRGMPGLFGMDFDEMMNQEDIGQAIAASLSDVDPMNPWVKDSRGRHTNLAVLYDWPELDETEGMSMPSTSMKNVLCARTGCPRVCVKNPRTGVYHRHCGISCKRIHDKEVLLRRAHEDLDGPSSSRPKSPKNLDIMIAMELSRLQMRKELENRASSFSSDSDVGEHSSRINDVFGEEKDIDYDLNLAIEMSLHDLQDKRLDKSEECPSFELDDMSESSMSEAASLKSSDFAHLNANEMFLDHLQKMTDNNTLKNIDPDK